MLELPAIVNINMLAACAKR